MSSDRSIVGFVSSWLIIISLGYLFFYGVVAALVGIVLVAIVTIAVIIITFISVVAILVGFGKLAAEKDKKVLESLRTFLKCFGVGLLASPVLILLAKVVFVTEDVGFFRLLGSILLAIPFIIALYGAPLVLLVSLAIILWQLENSLEDLGNLWSGEMLAIPVLTGMFFPFSVIIYYALFTG